jgi:biotin synthase
MSYEEILAKARRTHTLEKAEIVALLENEAKSELLFQAADAVRREFVGDGVHLRGLIEFSNICRQNCLYCGLRRDNLKAERYRLSPEEIIYMARQAKEFGYKTVVMQSGEDMWFDEARLCHIIREVKKLGLALTLSVGERSRAEYAAFKRAGADRYLLRIETTDKKLYEELDPNMTLENRLRCLMDLKELGYEVGTGIMVGLPKQTLASIAADILFFKEIDADMLGIGPFIANGDTPLAKEKNGSVELSFRVIAVLRLLMPDINIPATTAMETLAPNGRTRGLMAGANVVMPNVTEGDYRRKYALYPGKICINDTPNKCRFCIQGKIEGIGRFVSETQGFRRDNGKNVNIF